ncbi:hypothetical protein LRP30_33015 [Bradyrhizobium sp. C-145]|uniref:hypothetical protein n=1 Tax=Bradyrhizobium sp. C-145 TaxID=574727 RepID=UPI00201B88BC|nr:hypothetical protein [Bradyrhizobium sp. C-145]UQR61610.1 hypothetical protein LRP30_33015 [Bradyrhizobium sp. C-145]
MLNTSSDLREALSKSVGLTLYFHNNPYGIATIVIRDPLLAPQTINSPSDELFGLIGGLFPMIVSATYQPNRSTDKYGISFVIAGVTAQLGANGGTPTINAGIIVEDPQSTGQRDRAERSRAAGGNAVVLARNRPTDARCNGKPGVFAVADASACPGTDKIISSGRVRRRLGRR